MKNGGTLVAVNAEDGEPAWQHNVRREYVALIRAGDRVLVQDTTGKVVVFDPAADKFAPLAEYAVAETPTWSHPAFTGGVLLVKDKAHLTAWRVD
ncbi:MAG: PQQ-like beta-propeller repeat protein [Gemmataceae bacterium]|nr:PQQ-like beta-propeller repeat protein [Gemmataceae bacterium]